MTEPPCMYSRNLEVPEPKIFELTPSLLLYIYIYHSHVCFNDEVSKTPQWCTWDRDYGHCQSNMMSIRDFRVW